MYFIKTFFHKCSFRSLKKIILKSSVQTEKHSEAVLTVLPCSQAKQSFCPVMADCDPLFSMFHARVCAVISFVNISSYRLVLTVLVGLLTCLNKFTVTLNAQQQCQNLLQRFLYNPTVLQHSIRHRRYNQYLYSTVQLA